MKRLILLATMVAVLASCEKTEIQNEVLNEIGFSQKIGKQTKAIVDGSEFSTSQPFGVYAYAYQDGTHKNMVMNNVEIAYQEITVDNTTTNVWKATGSTKYYWPNDDKTHINFFAYSPSSTNASTVADHEKLYFVTGEGNGVSHTKENGLNLTNYQHTNKYVDFMVATPVIGAKYNVKAINGTVPVMFHHQLTQLIFTVKTSEEYVTNGVGPEFTINSITLNGINNQGTYACTNVTDTWADGVWSQQTGDATYEVFPVTNESATKVTKTNILKTTPITVIPQTLAANSQSLKINYTIEGEGVATETVERTIYFNGVKNNAQTPTALVWDVNKKITYNIVIGLKEILFQPTIDDWSPVESEEIEIFQ